MTMITAPPSCFARVHGVDVHWTELGRGRPLVLLHGLTDSHGTWGRVALRLASSRRVLMPDLPGHGLSSRPDATYALEWHAGVMGAWLAALGLEDVDLVGHSFGGGVAQWLLLEHRARIRRLALVAAGGLGREVSLGLRLCALPRVVERLGQPFMGIGTRVGMSAAGGVYDRDDIDHLAWMNSRPGSARALARTVSDVIDLGGQRRHFLDRAHEIGELPPTALYWGDRDPVIPIRHATEAAGVMEGAELTRFEGCGHFPHRERPDQFLRALEAFVDAPSRRPAVLRRAVMVPAGPRRAPWWRRAALAVARVLRRRRSTTPGRALRGLEGSSARRGGQSGLAGHGCADRGTRR